MCVNEKEGQMILDDDSDGYWRENGVWIHLKRGQKLFEC
jgi:hypothetical protein